MNTENRVSQDEVISPLNHDVTGAFSRKGTPPPEDAKNPLWLDSLLVVLFVTFLYWVDFILFAGSGNLRIFNGSIFPIAEVTIIMLLILLISSLLITPFHTQRPVKYVIASVLTFGVIYMLFRQFFQYHQQFSIGAYMMPVSVLVGIIIGCVTFVLFQQDRLLYRILLVVATAVLFFNVYITYYKTSENHEYEETYNIQKQSKEPNQRLIYFMFPNLTSYAYLSSIDSNEARETRDILQGFYQKYNYKVYSQAYIPEYGSLDNIIRSLNPKSDKSSKQHMMASHKLDYYWRFYNLRNEYVFLQNNEFYDALHEQNYQISAYKSRDIEMCRQKYDYSVSRCTEKVNRPTNLHFAGIPLSTRTTVLLMEWLSSVIPPKGLSVVYNILHNSLHSDSMPAMDFSNLYVINSPKIFDILAKDIKQDSGKQAYFVYVDLPSNMYIYDELCNIKDPKEWQSMIDTPWNKNNYQTDRQNAYLQQTRCLIGKLGQFMDKLQKEGLDDNTVVIVQGMSGVSDFKEDTKHDTATDQFVYDRTVSMAIRDNKLNDISVDSRFCATSQIMDEYLFANKKCGADLTGYHEKLIANLNTRLNELTAKINDNTQSIYENWYTNWLNKKSFADFEDAAFPTDAIFESDDDVESNGSNSKEFGVEVGL